jgi:hypothetical protein
MKVNQEEIPRRKRGGFLENRMEERKKVNLSKYRNRREKPEEG